MASLGPVSPRPPVVTSSASLVVLQTPNLVQTGGNFRAPDVVVVVDIGPVEQLNTRVQATVQVVSAQPPPVRQALCPMSPPTGLVPLAIMAFAQAGITTLTELSIRPSIQGQKMDDSIIATAACLSFVFGPCSGLVLNAQVRDSLGSYAKCVETAFVHLGNACVEKAIDLFSGERSDALRPCLPTTTFPPRRLNEGLTAVKKLATVIMHTSQVLAALGIPICTPMALTKFSTYLAQKMQGDEVNDNRFFDTTTVLIWLVSFPLWVLHLHRLLGRAEALH
jgi:hypothetical protein